jgi:hypothetical protein
VRLNSLSCVTCLVKDLDKTATGAREFVLPDPDGDKLVFFAKR